MLGFYAYSCRNLPGQDPIHAQIARQLPFRKHFLLVGIGRQILISFGKQLVIGRNVFQTKFFLGFANPKSTSEIVACEMGPLCVQFDQPLENSCSIRCMLMR